MRKLWLLLFVVALVVPAQAQDHTARDYRALRWIWIDSTGTMPTGIAGRAALWSRGVNGLYSIFANGTYARLDSGGTGSGYGASPDTVAGIYIDKRGIGAGDIIVHNGSYWVLNAGIASLGGTNHTTFYNAAGDSIRTFLGFMWKHATLDTLYVGGKLSKVEAIRFDDGTTMTTGAGSSVSDVAFADTWNGVTTTAPSKNAIWIGSGTSCRKTLCRHLWGLPVQTRQPTSRQGRRR